MRRIMLWAVLCVLLPSLAAADTEITLTLGGDCVLGTREEWTELDGNFEDCVETQGMDWCFSGISGLFSQDDLTLINLECVLQDNNTGHNSKKQHTFRGKTAYTQILTDADIEAVNLANNHTIDYGESGKKSTRAVLRTAGILYCGYQDLFVFEKDGIKIGFGGCRETVFFEEGKACVSDDIQKLKDMGCDAIVYSCHWGQEYSPVHNRKQETMAQYAVDCGADIVVGTHPHVVQGVEVRDGVLVLYSLGNLVFGGTHDMRTFDAVLACATLHFDDAGCYTGVQLELIPVLTSGSVPDNDFCPVLADMHDAERILGLVQADSTIAVTQPMWFSSDSVETIALQP